MSGNFLIEKYKNFECIIDYAICAYIILCGIYI